MLFEHGISQRMYLPSEFSMDILMKNSMVEIEDRKMKYLFFFLLVLISSKYFRDCISVFWLIKDIQYVYFFGFAVSMKLIMKQSEIICSWAYPTGVNDTKYVAVI